MLEDLLRFVSPVSPSELPEVLSGSTNAPVEKTGQRANLEPVEKIFRKLEAQGKRKTGDYDIAMCEALHRQLKHLPAPVKLDMAMWHWLTIKRFPDFVWIRWYGKVPPTLPPLWHAAGWRPDFWETGRYGGGIATLSLDCFSLPKSFTTRRKATGLRLPRLRTKTATHPCLSAKWDSCPRQRRR